MNHLTHIFYQCLIFSLAASNCLPEYRNWISVPLLAIALIIYGYQRGLKVATESESGE